MGEGREHTGWEHYGSSSRDWYVTQTGKVELAEHLSQITKRAKNKLDRIQHAFAHILGNALSVGELLLDDPLTDETALEEYKKALAEYHTYTNALYMVAIGTLISETEPLQDEKQLGHAVNVVNRFFRDVAFITEQLLEGYGIELLLADDEALTVKNQTLQQEVEQPSDSEIAKRLSEIERIKYHAMREIDQLAAAYDPVAYQAAHHTSEEKLELYGKFHELAFHPFREIGALVPTDMESQINPVFQRTVRDMAVKAQAALWWYFNKAYYQATGEFYVQTELKPRTKRRREPKQKGTDSPYLNALVACATMIQLWRMGGGKEGAARPQFKPSESIQQAIEQYKDSGREHIVVEIRQNGDVKNVLHTLPSKRDQYESRPIPPILESLAAGKVLPVFDAVNKELLAENEVFAEKAEKQRKRERAAQVRYQKRYREQHPEEAKEKEAKKKRRYRAKKKLEAQKDAE